MNKLDIIKEVHRAAGITEPEAAQLVELVLSLLKTTLTQGEHIIIAGFGTFNVRRKQARYGRNPRNGQPVLISPRKVVTFRVSPLWKQYVNEETRTSVSTESEKTRPQSFSPEPPR